MYTEMQLLDRHLSTEDGLAEVAIQKQMRTRKQEQVHILNGLLIKMIRILEEEKKTA